MNNGREALDHGNKGLLKLRKHTQQAAASLKCILEKQAHHMPHRTRTLKTGEKVVSMCLPATFQWKKQIKELNNVNAAFGLKGVSTSSLSKIRASKFLEFEVKKPGDNFARCATCDTLQALKRASLAGSITNLKWSRKLGRHLAIACAHRDYYYINRYRSHNFPHECLTVMHDKMDHTKTASLVFSHKSKDLDGLVKLPLSVTGMIAHGHGDVRYAHYGLDLFPHNSNYWFYGQVVAQFRVAAKVFFSRTICRVKVLKFIQGNLERCRDVRSFTTAVARGFGSDNSIATVLFSTCKWIMPLVTTKTDMSFVFGLC